MASAQESTDEVKARIEMIPVDEAKREIAEGVRVIDVREQNEWDESHLEGAIHIPQAEVAERIDEIAPDRSERLIVHCRTDNRSARIVDLLGELGYEDAVRGRGRASSRGRKRATRSSTRRASRPSSATATRATRSCPRSASRARSPS